MSKSSSSTPSPDTTIYPADSAEVATLKQVLQKERDEFQRELAWAKLKNEVLEAKLRKLLLSKYGPSSEKLSDDQLRLLELEPGVSDEEAKAESDRGEEELADRPKRKREAKEHPGRQTLPAHLPRVEEIVQVPAAQCFCAACQTEMAVIGYEESEQLDVKPAEYFVRLTKREKRACSACGKGGVKTAPVTPSIVEKSLVSDRIVVETVMAKYLNHLPLYRQSAMLARDAGVEIHRSTMCGWVMRVGELLLPVAEALRRELLTGNYIQADETPIEVQMHDGRGKNHQAYLWQYSAPSAGDADRGSGGIVLFDFQMGRGREAPKRMLRDFAGILQTDGYAAYDKVGAPGMVQAACWAHARRKFVEALKLNAKDAEAARMVARMDALFAIDGEARDGAMDIEQRHALRLAKAAALVAALREELLRLQKSTLPKSAMGQAVNYTLSLWKKLTVFLTHPVVELSNNLAENSMRGVALGRRNWIHLGSENAGPKVAAILSIAETCRRGGIPLREYLLDVLPGMADRKRSEADKLTPSHWKQGRS